LNIMIAISPALCNPKAKVDFTVGKSNHELLICDAKSFIVSCFGV
jgi:hypothetical protein